MSPRAAHSLVLGDQAQGRLLRQASTNRFLLCRDRGIHTESGGTSAAHQVHMAQAGDSRSEGRSPRRPRSLENFC